MKVLGAGGIGVCAWGAGTATVRAAHASEAHSIGDFGAIPDPGHNNRPAIQAAIDALPSEGGTVLIPAGSWGVSFVDADGILLGSNVHLTGIGESSELFVNSQTEMRTHVVRNRDWENGNENCRVSSLTINCGGQGRNFAGNSWEINGVTFRNSAKCSATNLRVLDGRGYGIWLVSSEHCNVSGCYVRNFSDCIELVGGAQYNTISSNSIESTGAFNWVSSGILAYGRARRNTIVGNVITGGYGQCLSTTSKYGHGNDNVFAANVVDAYNSVGISISGNRNLFQGNQVRTFLQSAVVFDPRYGSATGNVVESNVFEADLRYAPVADRAAVELQDEASHTLIGGNSITSIGRDCISLRGRAITIANNQLQMDSAGYWEADGIRVHGVDVLISGNHLSARNGIVVEGGQNIVLGANLVVASGEPVVDPIGLVSPRDSACENACPDQVIPEEPKPEPTECPPERHKKRKKRKKRRRKRKK